ncbi:Protein kinase-like domain protein [Niveomyces insectorum RCEF 264]|uniref:Protein kinase-like domain protein n=1 Tax=Niveomyces insectorum RCEF 264 TaxID=1081102 RepID=A0A167LX22_9HYPO|nr:Protein kinase-like domain protein [Niveomyces insectorum RCEF 264]
MEHTSHLAEEAAKLTLEELRAEREKVGDHTEDGRSHGLLPEARTQQFAHDGLAKMPPDERQGIHVPRILRLVQYDSGSGYIVMEYVPGKTLEHIHREHQDMTPEDSQPYYDAISRALRLFLAIPVPADAQPGPVGGGIIHHALFKGFVAPIKYDSVDMLEKHMNKLATLLNDAAPTVTLERDLHLVFSDLHMGNFLFTEHGDLYVVDFDHASLLPLSFMAFTLGFPSTMSCRVAARIEKDFDLPQENFKVMLRVSSHFERGTRKIGLPL